jgi:hypothetical protein
MCVLKLCDSCLTSFLFSSLDIGLQYILIFSSNSMISMTKKMVFPIQQYSCTSIHICVLHIWIHLFLCYSSIRFNFWVQLFEQQVEFTYKTFNKLFNNNPFCKWKVL